MPGKIKSAVKVEKASNQQEEWLSLRMRRVCPEFCGLAIITRKTNISMYMKRKEVSCLRERWVEIAVFAQRFDAA